MKQNLAAFKIAVIYNTLMRNAHTPFYRIQLANFIIAFARKLAG